MGKYRDFDRSRKEPEPIGFRYAGQEYTVRGGMKLFPLLNAMRVLEKFAGSDDLGNIAKLDPNDPDASEGLTEVLGMFDEIRNVIRSLVGPANFERLEPDLEMEDMQDVLSWLIEQLTGNADLEDVELTPEQEEEAMLSGEGDPKAPESPSDPSSSSNTSTRSEPTSLAIMASEATN